MTPDVEEFGIRVDRGIKVYTLGIPSCIASIFDLDSMPTFVTDFGKGRFYITINFIINEGSDGANQTKLLEWSAFIRSNCFKADHTYLSIGNWIVNTGEPLTDSNEGVEGKVLRLFARRRVADEALYCTLQFAHCVELEII